MSVDWIRIFFAGSRLVPRKLSVFCPATKGSRAANLPRTCLGYIFAGRSVVHRRVSRAVVLVKLCFEEKNGYWNNEKELQFIEYYQAEPVLWNVKLKEYKNKFKTNDAWRRISEMMEVEVEELKKKKDSLMSSYRSYRNKVKKSAASGAGADEIYQPIWFAYDAMDSFLNDTLKVKKTINTESMPIDEQPHQNHEEENQDNLEEEKENQSQSVNIPNTPNDRNKVVRRRQNSSEIVTAGNVVKEALDTFKNTMKIKGTAAQPSVPDDDCDLYGKHMAMKLRKLPYHKRLKIMHKIDGMFLDEEPPSPVPSQSPVRYPLLQSKRKHDFNPYIQSEPSFTFMEPRPGTSSSSYSEPPMHYAPMSATQTSPNIIIHSNELVNGCPVIHVQDRDTAADNHINLPNSDNEDIIRRALYLS